MGESLVRILFLHGAAPRTVEPAAASVVVAKASPAVAPLLQPEVGGARVTDLAINESQTIPPPPRK
jgi:hypothetical protein